MRKWREGGTRTYVLLAVLALMVVHVENSGDKERFEVYLFYPFAA